jgi:nickel-dependent lactate racemase
LLLPPLLGELEKAGVKDSDIVIVLALGIHRQHTEQEKATLVGSEVFAHYRVLDHDPSQCQCLGRTSRGTYLDVFSEVALADFRITLGNVEYHYFAGYSGGAKAILPGVSSHRAICHNHSLMTDSLAQAGNLVGNPVRLDIDELANYLSVDFIFNVVLGEDKKVRSAYAGHYLAAHRAACQSLDAMFQVPVKSPGADIVLVSAGGFPKDINVYQAQKALDNAAKAVRVGGSIIWVAQCAEGFGEDVFERWLNEAKKPVDLVNRVKTNFELGGHKAAAIALVLERCKVFMVSDLPTDVAKKLFVEPKPNLDSALESALAHSGNQAKVLVIPYGGSTLPKIMG